MFIFVFFICIFTFMSSFQANLYSSVANFINSYNFENDDERKNPIKFINDLKTYLESLNEKKIIPAVLAVDEHGNNGIMSFINAGIAGGGNGKNIFVILNQLPDDMETLKKALTSLNDDNQSALSLAFNIGDFTTQFALSSKIGKNHDILREKDKNGYNFVLKALIEDLSSYFLPWGGQGFKTLVLDNSILAKELLLEEIHMTTNKGIKFKMQGLPYALYSKKNDLFNYILQIFDSYAKEKETVKSIVLDHNQNIFFWAACSETPNEIVQNLLARVDTYERLSDLLLLNRYGPYSAVITATKKNNVDFLQSAFQAFYYLAQKKPVSFEKLVGFKEILLVLRLFLIENKKELADEQLIPAVIAIIEHFNPEENPAIQIPEIIERSFHWVEENRSILSLFDRDELVDFLQNKPEPYPSKLIIQLAVLKNSLVKLKEKFEQLKTKLVNLKTEIIL